MRRVLPPPRVIVALTMLASACTPTPDESSSRTVRAQTPPAAAAPAAGPETTADASAEVTPPPRGQLGETSVRVPDDYVALADDERERLRLGALRRNPRAHVELDGRRSSRGVQYGMGIAMRVDNDDLPGFYGETVRTSTALLEQMARTEFGELDPGTTVALEPNEQGRYIDMLATVPLPERGEMRLRSRHWATPDGVFYEVGCQCAGPGCAFGDETCALPQPPADALELDTPIDGGTPPRTLEIAGGRARAAAPPFFTEASAEEIDALADLARKGDKRMTRVDVQALVGPRADTGIVMLTDATWCRKARDGCTTDVIAKASRDAQLTVATLEGHEPTVSTTKQVVNRQSYDGYEIRVGLLSWERHLFWQDGPRVREVACTCGGPACAVAERTCELTPPKKK